MPSADWRGKMLLTVSVFFTMLFMVIFLDAIIREDSSNAGQDLIIAGVLCGIIMLRGMGVV